MATKYILDPSGKIIKADSGDKIDPVVPGTEGNPHYTKEVLKNISAKENDNDSSFDSFLSNVKLGLLEGEADQDRLTRYITSKVDQDPSFGFIDEEGKTKLNPDQVDSFKPFNSFTNTSKVFADEFEMLTGFRLRTNEFEESLQTTLLMFSYFAELIAKFATAEVIILLNQNQNIEINKKNIRKTSLRLGRYDFTEYDILTKYIYNVLNYPHESSSFSERIMAYFVGFTEWLSPDIVLDYNEILNQSSETYSNTLSYSKNNERVGDFSNILQDTFKVALISLLEILASTALNHTSINRVRLLLRKFYQERLFKQRDLYKAKPQNQFTESTEVQGLEVPSVDVLGFFDDLNYYYFKFMIERIQVGLPILLKYYYKKDMFVSGELISELIGERHNFKEHPKNRVSANKPRSNGEEDKVKYTAPHSHWSSTPYDKVNRIYKSTTRISAMPQAFLDGKHFIDLFARMDRKSKILQSTEEIKQSLQSTADRRLSISHVNKLEQDLESEYMPFYIHDVRTNEVLSFHAFIESISDSFSPEYNSSSGFGRIDDVKTYVKTTRNINLTFILAATSKDDHDLMWYQANKIVSLVYPQWSSGFNAITTTSSRYNPDNKEDTSSFALNFPFKYPFTQVPTASPLIRLRVGDIIKSNYSRENLARLHGINENIDEEVIRKNIKFKNFDSIKIAEKELKKAIQKDENFFTLIKELENTDEYKNTLAAMNMTSLEIERLESDLTAVKSKQIKDVDNLSEQFQSDQNAELLRNRDLQFEQYRDDAAGNVESFDFMREWTNKGINIYDNYITSRVNLLKLIETHKKWKESGKNPQNNEGLTPAEARFAKLNYKKQDSDKDEYLFMYGQSYTNPNYIGIFDRKPSSFIKRINNQIESLDLEYVIKLEKHNDKKREYDKKRQIWIDATSQSTAEALQQDRQDNFYPEEVKRLEAEISQKRDLISNLEKEQATQENEVIPEIIELQNNLYNKGLNLSKKTTAEQKRIKKQVKEEIYKKIIDKKVNNKTNNPITISYESGMSRGLAGFITNLDMSYNDSTWEIDEGSRAPMLIKINIGFSPIHDIPPGLDHHGSMRAPIYNVGKINNHYFGDSIMTDNELNSKES